MHQKSSPIEKKSISFSKEIDNNSHQFELSSFLEKFDHNVSLFGDKYAINSYETKMTYLQLDRLSDNLAFFLKHTGVKKGDFVGVCLASDAMWIVSLLAILKIGGIYFPIDPNYPIDRIAYMISNT